MNAEILCVGTEILLGDILNTNSQYLSKRLADFGITLYNHSVVGDNEQRLIESLKIAFNRADIVITTGGLGPTQDDITKEVGSKFFNKELYLHEESLERIKTYFKSMNRVMSDNNVKQAYFPKDSIILPNDNGTAPGCIIEENNKVLIILPGPPKETQPMFENYVVPYLKKFSKDILFSKVVRTIGIGESAMESMVSDIVKDSINPTVAPYAKEGEAILRITAKASTEEEALKLIEPVEKEIRKRLGNYIYGVGDSNIQTEVAKLLVEKKLTIATAESCTGGLVAARLIDYPGISEVFMQGAVTYSNEAKMQRLGVKEETLEKYGAVSSQTAKEMAEGIAKTSGTNIGLSTTGIAGPGGGTLEKPVGLVYVGIYINGTTVVKELKLNGSRERIRNRAVMELLNFLRLELLK